MRSGLPEQATLLQVVKLASMTHTILFSSKTELIVRQNKQIHARRTSTHSNCWPWGLYAGNKNLGQVKA